MQTCSVSRGEPYARSGEDKALLLQESSIDVSFIKKEFHSESDSQTVSAAGEQRKAGDELSSMSGRQMTSKDAAEKSQVVHSDFFHTCEFCGRNFTFRHSYNRHIIFCSDNDKLKDIVDMSVLKCMLCEKSFCKVAYLRVHASKHVGLFHYKCKLCDTTTYVRSSMTRHLLRSHKIDTSDCDSYMEHYSYPTYKQVAATSDEEKSLAFLSEEDCTNAPIAKKPCTNLQTLWVTKSPGKPSEVVKSCRQSIDPSVKAEEDIAEMKPKDFEFNAKKFQCEICQTFILKHHFKRHVRLCKDNEKIKKIVDMNNLYCLMCKKTFYNSHHLKRHAAKHWGLDRFTCKICGYGAYYRSDVKSHLPVHKNIACSDCETYIVELEISTSKNSPDFFKKIKKTNISVF